MKVSRLFMAAMLAAALPLMCAQAADVNPGDTRAQVIEALGNPMGEITSGTYELLTYDRGKVELRDGKVTKAELITEEQAEVNRQVQEQKQAEAQRLAAEARAHRIAEGSEIRRTKLIDAAFISLPAADRVAFWQNFKKLYPEVPLGEEYTIALRELEQDLTAQRLAQAQDQKIADLERRVAEAEQRARQASQQSTVVVDGYPYGYPYVYGYLPVSRPRPPICNDDPVPAPRIVTYPRGASAPISYAEAYSMRYKNDSSIAPKPSSPAPAGSSVHKQGSGVSVTIQGF